MALLFTLTLFTAQALSTLLPIAQPTPTPSIISTSTTPFCPGSITTLAPLTYPFVSTDTSDPDTPYCCVGDLRRPAPPLTKWLYNHTGTAIPSIVVRPTTCVQPIPLSATDYAARATAAAIAHVFGASRGPQRVMQLQPAEWTAESDDSVRGKYDAPAPRVLEGAAARAGRPPLVAALGMAAGLGSVVMSTPFVLAFVLMWITAVVGP